MLACSAGRSCRIHLDTELMFLMLRGQPAMKGLTRYHWLIRQPIKAFCGVNKEVNSESRRDDKHQPVGCSGNRWMICWLLIRPLVAIQKYFRTGSLLESGTKEASLLCRQEPADCGPVVVAAERQHFLRDGQIPFEGFYYEMNEFIHTYIYI